MKHLRSEWLNVVVRECQVLAGELGPERHAPLRPLMEGFITRIPEPGSQVERVFLRGILLETAMRWGDDNHHAFHRLVADDRCVFVTSEVAARNWRGSSESPKAIFSRWATDYATAFDRAHPLHCAMETRRAIDVGYAKSLTIDELARNSGVSSGQLRREFGELTGMTVSRYLKQRRLDVAITLLRETDDKVEWIARQVGWSSRKNLNRALARSYGLTPAEIRESPSRPVPRSELRAQNKN